MELNCPERSKPTEEDENDTSGQTTRVQEKISLEKSQKEANSAVVGDAKRWLHAAKEGKPKTRI